jgi:hypothetical protein
MSSRTGASSRALVYLFTLGLGLFAAVYLALLGRAWWISSISLVDITESWSGLSLREHMAWGWVLYTLLVGALAVAAFTIRRRDALALIPMCFALPLLLSDHAHGFYEVAFIQPWLPREGPAFERFYSELHVPEQIWRAFMCVLLLAIGWCAHGIAARSSRSAYRWAMGVALVTGLLLAWLSLGVGIIGRDGERANAMYLGVIVIGIAGAFIAQFRPQGMARALIATAAAQAVAAAIAVFGGLGRPWSGALELILLNGFFIALFLGSAWLFRRAAAGPEALPVN